MSVAASRRRGFAMLPALALLVLISLAALELSAASRPRRLATAGVAEHLVGAEAASAGIEHARATLLRMERGRVGRWTRATAFSTDAWSAADGMIIGPVPIDDWTYRVELRDANARLPLNSATEQQLRLLLQALRVDARRAARLAAAIADWRDADQIRRLDGAERTEYLRAGLPMMPEDHPFASVATLRFVVGVSDSLFQLLRPYLTVVGSGLVNINAAARPVLLTLPGMTEESASLILRRRVTRPVDNLYRFADELSPSARRRWRETLPLLESMAITETREVHARSEAWQPSGSTRVQIDAVISRDAEGRSVWRRVLP